MKAEQFRDMSIDDLQAEARNLTEQLFKLRFQLATGQLENVNRVRGVRKDLARLKTVLNEKKRVSGAAGRAAAAERREG